MKMRIWTRMWTRMWTWTEEITAMAMAMWTKKQKHK
jgi:hypothetical protein